MSFVVGLKYCGHCQPHMSMSEFAGDLSGLLHNVAFTRWDDFGTYSVLLILNACPSQCAHVKEVETPKVVLSNQSLNYREYSSREELLRATAELLNNMAGALETDCDFSFQSK